MKEFQNSIKGILMRYMRICSKEETMQVYTDKEVLADGLSAQKCSTNLFNMAMNECVHENVRETFSRILDEEHIIQVDVFEAMHKRGFYETPAADEMKVQQAAQKFAKSRK